MQVGTSSRPSRPKCALLLIDFQVDFLRDNGRLPIARDQVEPVLAAARQAMNDARAERVPMIAIGSEFRPSDWLRNLFRRNAAIAGSPGAAWDDRLPVHDAAYIPKWKSNAFCNPALEQRLSEMRIREVVLTGLFARGCIAATAMGALARCFRVRILTPAVACATEQSKVRALERLAKMGAELSLSLSGRPYPVFQVDRSTSPSTSGTL